MEYPTYIYSQLEAGSRSLLALGEITVPEQKGFHPHLDWAKREWNAPDLIASVRVVDLSTDLPLSFQLVENKEIRVACASPVLKLNPG